MRCFGLVWAGKDGVTFCQPVLGVSWVLVARLSITRKNTGITNLYPRLGRKLNL